MSSRLSLLLSTTLLVLLGSMPIWVTAQQTAKPGDIELPPITWACPMNGVVNPDGSIHADVFEDGPGTCQICKMALAAVRLDSIFTCPVHSVIHERKGGKCPLDGRDLVPITVAVSFTCDRNPEIDQITPGKCPDGTDMTTKYTPRAHGNHNPQHGGLFFMAPDSWTHVEGVFPQPGLLRIYLYDDYTKPLPADKFKPIQGRIITKTTAGGATKEVSFPLVQNRNGLYLEAKVDTRAAPAAMVAKIKLKADAPEYHFDFAFAEFSKEPVPGSTSTSTPPAAPRVQAPAAPAVVTAAPAAAPAQTATAATAQAPAPSAPPQTPPATAPMQMPGQNPLIPVMVNPALINVKIPDTVEEIVREITTRDGQIRELVEAGRFADIWLPAFEAKDLALAMGTHAAQLPTYKRRLLDPAIKRLMHAAWMLDAFGDLGNREQITQAFGDFDAAAKDIQSIFLQEGR